MRHQTPPRHHGTTRSGRALRAVRTRSTAGTATPRRTLWRNTKVRLCALLAMLLTGLGLPLFMGMSSSNAARVPTTPVFTKAIEAYPRFVSEAGCSPWIKPGTAKLKALLTKTYPGVAANTDAQRCGTRKKASSHDDGRAIDWMTNVNNATQRGYADSMINWMLKDNQANARRLGVMYIIWNNQMFRMYDVDRGWARYKGCSGNSGSANTCHRNHVHISLTPYGGTGESSFWSGSGTAVAASTAKPAPQTPRLLYTGETTYRNVTKGQLITIGGVTPQPNQSVQLYIKKVGTTSYKKQLSPAVSNGNRIWSKRYLVGVDHYVYVRTTDMKNLSKSILITVKK